jgi:hypothetical protein
VLTDPSSLRQLYATLSAILNCHEPDRDFNALAKDFRETAARLSVTDANEARSKGGTSEAITKRLRRSLESGLPWRSVEWLAIEAGVSEEVAAELLRPDDSVRFTRGRSGNMIVGLVDRVGRR